jgi:hypothetical protein
VIGGYKLWNIPSKNKLSKLPALYETEKIPLEEKEIHLHFFIGGCDWYIAEFDGNDLFFGYTILNNDYQNAEWGYISFNELKSVKLKNWLEVDCDKFWKKSKVKNIEKIIKEK